MRSVPGIYCHRTLNRRCLIYARWIVLERNNNIAMLCGFMADRPRFSHENRGENYYIFPLSIERLSGNVDTVNVIVRERLMTEANIERPVKIKISGELRSFNNKCGEGSRLVITVFARQICFSPDSDRNFVELTGTICKPPTLRRTPMGREICDIMLAVNRRYGRSDYLPCIAWGKIADYAGDMAVGDEIHITGRLQSRAYIKAEEDRVTERTAYEVSVTSLEPVGGASEDE